MDMQISTLKNGVQTRTSKKRLAIVNNARQLMMQQIRQHDFKNLEFHPALQKPALHPAHTLHPDVILRRS